LIAEEEESDPGMAKHLREFKDEFQVLLDRWKAKLNPEQYVDLLENLQIATNEMEEVAAAKFYGYEKESEPKERIAAIEVIVERNDPDLLSDFLQFKSAIELLSARPDHRAQSITFLIYLERLISALREAKQQESDA